LRAPLVAGARSGIDTAKQAWRALTSPAERGGRVAGRVDSVKAYAEAIGAPYQRLHPAESIERQPPCTIDGRHPPVFEALRQHYHPETFRALLPRARIAGRDPLVLTPDFRALRESTFDLDQLNANPVMSSRLQRPKRVRGTHMVLLNPWCQAYFHWMLDTLPRLALLPVEEHPNVPLIVPARLSRFQSESLALAGIDRSRLVPFDHTHMVVEELWFPSLAGRTGNPRTWTLEWLRSTLTPADPGFSSRRLYVSRADARLRSVSNESEVVAVLAERGFEVFIPGDMSLAEQLRLFSEASAIVGPHGAGLMNAFAARDAVVIELFEPRYVNGCYYALADALGHAYWYLMCEPSGETDLEVDLNRLGATLDRAGI
jgi:capsular polysaccharide biosynthesis protein